LTDELSAANAALNLTCVTKALALKAGARSDAGDCAAAADLINNEVVVWFDMPYGGLLDCGRCKAIEVTTLVVKVVGVSGSAGRFGSPFRAIDGLLCRIGA
jgi:hypothetical protein